MAAPVSEDFIDIEGIFHQELELLQEIFIHEIEIKNESSGYPYEVSLKLHPATADRADLQYVTLTLVFTISKEYPNVVPNIKIKNPRGLSEEEVVSLQKRLTERAAERTGEAMLYELVTIAQESLTSNNTPSCPCVICYHSFQETDEFTRTSCYHYYHGNCLSRYISYAKQNEETPVCPVCREELSSADSPSDTVTPSDAQAPKFTPDPELKVWQEEMAILKDKQAQKGGIIDVTANSNKFLLDISSTPSTPMISMAPDESRDQGIGSDLTDDREKSDALINKDRHQRSGRGSQTRVVSSYYSYKRGDSAGGNGRRGRGRSGGRGGHERGRERRDGPPPVDGRDGSTSSTKTGGPKERGGGLRDGGLRSRGLRGSPRGRGGAHSIGRGGQSGSRSETELNKEGKALDTKKQQQKGACGTSTRQEQNSGEREEEGFNFYGNIVEKICTEGEQKTKNDEALIGSAEIGVHGRRQEADCGERGDSVKEEGFSFYSNKVEEKCTEGGQRPKNKEVLIERTMGAKIEAAGNGRTDKQELEEVRVKEQDEKRGEQKIRERNRITRWRPRENRRERSTTNKVRENDREKEKSDKRPRDRLKENTRRVDDVTKTNSQLDKEESVGGRLKGHLADDQVVSGGMGGTDSIDGIRGERGEDSLGTESVADRNTVDQMINSAGCHGGTRKGHQGRGRGRRSFTNSDRKGSGIHQDKKASINKGQRKTGNDSRNSNGHAQGIKNYERRSRPQSAKEGDITESSSRTKIDQNHLKQGHGRFETVKSDSDGRTFDRSHPNCKTAPPGFDNIPKPRVPPGFEDFR